MRVRVNQHSLVVTTEDEPRHRLTEGAEYFVIGIYVDAFRIMDDDSEPIIFPKRLFKISDPTLPPDWQFTEGNGGDYYITPIRSAPPGFYEDYFGSDGDLDAQLKARQTLREVLEAALAWGQDADKVLLRRDLKRMKTHDK
jgi:hypothetical protein